LGGTRAAYQGRGQLGEQPKRALPPRGEEPTCPIRNICGEASLQPGRLFVCPAAILRFPSVRVIADHVEPYTVTPKAKGSLACDRKLIASRSLLSIQSLPFSIYCRGCLASAASISDPTISFAGNSDTTTSFPGSSSGGWSPWSSFLTGLTSSE
jgi:hypothetical protein